MTKLLFNYILLDYSFSNRNSYSKSNIFKYHINTPNEEPASFPPGDSNFNSWPTVLGHPPGPVI